MEVQNGLPEAPRPRHHRYMYVCMCIYILCIYRYIDIMYVYIYIYIHIHTIMCVYTWVYIYIYTHTTWYINIYVCIYDYVFINIYIYIYMSSARSFVGRPLMRASAKKNLSELLRVSQRLSLALVARQFLWKENLWERIALRAISAPPTKNVCLSPALGSSNLSGVHKGEFSKGGFSN